MRAFISEIAVSSGSNVICNRTQAREFGVENEFLNEKIGVLKMPELAETETSLDIAFSAATKLSKAVQNVDVLIYVTQNPEFGGLPHNSAVLAKYLGLSNDVGCFDVGLGCSGYVYALSIASAMIESGRYRSILVVTCDTYRKNLNPMDKNTSLLFGDWASATLINTAGKWLIGASKLKTFGDGFENLIRRRDGIYMNGRGVFNFARNEVTKSIVELLETDGIDINQIDLFLVHQGSKAIIEQLRKKLGVERDKMPIAIRDTGNAVSSSIPLLLKDRFSLNISTMLLSGFGVGLSIGNILIHEETKNAY